MFCKSLLLFAAMCCHGVCASYHHGPLAKPVVLKSGYLADTHEVAAAKNAHIAALHKESHSHGYGADYGYGSSHGYEGKFGYSQGYGHGYSHDDHDHLKYHGPTAIPHVLHDGHIADTHEVAAAKADHYAAVAKARSHGGYGHDYSGQYATGYGGYHGYHGPLAKPVVLHTGYLADTHEVAAAKAEHYAAVAKARSHGGYGHNYSGQYATGYAGYHGYHGPLAKPVVLHTGYLADTHEVAAAKAEHYAAVAKARSHGGYGHNYSGQYATGYAGYHGYHGPLAKPVVLHTGYLADTHEVAAAKAEHYAAVAKARSHGGYGHNYSGQYATGYGGYHGYHGPLAKPVVLHTGYLADTHEVAAAKAEHYAAVAKARSHGGYGHDYSGQYATGYGGYHGYHGPLAKPVVLHNGYLADTQEVAAAKHHHLEALHSAHHGSHYNHHY